MSLRLAISSFFTRLVIKPWLRRAPDAPTVRAAFEKHAARLHLHPPLSDYRNGSIDDVPVIWVSRGLITSDDILLYIHGGGFVAGSPNTHKHMASYLAGRLGCEAVMPNYRKAPEYPYPAAFEDVLKIYKGVIARGTDPSQIVIGGDSAGGGLTMSLLAHISRHKMPLPKCAFAFSPAVDFTQVGASFLENKTKDTLLLSERFDEIGQMYLAGQDPSDPKISPVFADFNHCPPILIHVSDNEILRDDSLALQSKLVADGVEVLVRSWPNAFHVFHIMIGWFPEAREALDDVVSFIHSK